MDCSLHKWRGVLAEFYLKSSVLLVNTHPLNFQLRKFLFYDALSVRCYNISSLIS